MSCFLGIEQSCSECRMCQDKKEEQASTETVEEENLKECEKENDLLKSIRDNILKARRHANLSTKYQDESFDLLQIIGIEASQIKTNAENADDLEQAITCYISYGEYSIYKIMEEIKNVLKAGGVNE